MQLVEKIIAAKRQYDESDRPWLEKLAEGQLTKIAADCGCTAETIAGAGSAAPEPGKDAGQAPAETAPASSTVNAAAVPVAPAKPPTEAEWLAAAPAGLQEEYSDLRAARQAKQAELRTKIVAQSRGKLTEEYLAGKSTAELETLVAATQPVDFSTRGVAMHDATSPKQSGPSKMPGIKVENGQVVAAL